jgi:rod shape determining protein RodA
MFKSLKYFDWLLFAAVIILTLFGLLMIYSTGMSGGPESRLWPRQLVFIAIGLLGLFFLSQLDHRYFQKNSSIIYVLCLLLLVAVLIFGQEIRGTRRWFDFGVFNFQPAELSKFALIVVLAKFFQIRKPLLQKFPYIFWSFLYVLFPASLIILQPDLGSAAVFFAIWLGMLLVSSIPRRFFGYLLVFFLLVFFVSWQFFLQDYQKERLASFLNPGADPLGGGYNVRQAIVAVGAGGVSGSGLARGLQSQLKFLPERQTDFIFASTVEELGIIGGGLVIALLLFVLWRMYKITRNARDLFATYVAAGIFFLIFTQSIVNLGMNLGLVPVTGISLPFLSYGGSNLVVLLWLVGIMENIARTAVPVRFG